jgi:outer membrane protein assembly factor BamE (lipoprotein component of BamABCDE complex)
MTRDEVLMSLGHPPTHYTPTLQMNLWTYWHGRFGTYKVVFNRDGFVSQIVGDAAASNDTPVRTVSRR